MAWSIFTQGGGDAVAVAWAKQLLSMINAPQTPGNIQFIYDWEKSEGGGGKYNPLNQGPVPGKPQLTTTGSQYGGGAADYASWQAGLQGAVDYLNMPNYTQVLAALKAGNSAGARNALWASPWAASHYGYGSSWYNGPVPGGTNNISATMFSGGTSGTASSSSGGVTNASYSPATCVIGLPFPSSGISACLFSKTEARALIGGMLLASGTIIGIVGTVILVAFALKRTGALGAVANAASVVPFGGTVARSLNSTKGRIA